MHAMNQMRFDTPEPAIIEQKAHEALARLPEAFRPHLTDIVIRVEEFADAETLAEMNIANPWQLVGLYRGHPVNRQSVWASGDLPPTVYLYRQPLLLRQQQTGATLEAVVNHLVVHEVGHHFGLSDADMHALEDM
jgi:predicted Zn-dependent protease with MMP-like domain